MISKRQKTAYINIFVSFVCQIITILCGLIIPRLMLSAFGSEAYGLTTSITQFLGYITLLEGGIGGVARSVLYKPLASNDKTTISMIMNEIIHFFRIVAWIFVAYVLVLALSYKYISNTNYFDWVTTFIFVIVIGISTFGQYYIGIAYTVLLQAAQKIYIINILSIIGLVFNTGATIILIEMGCNLLMVKLISSCIFLIKPIMMWLYVKYKYDLNRNIRAENSLLEQKWNGLGQHIAFFLHSNTDIVVLTLFTNLTFVAIYSVYNMIISNIKNLVMSFHAGMEAVFGDMLAKGEMQEVKNAFDKYEMLISVVSCILFSVTIVMIIPFVKIYTLNINDANYVMPVFSVLISLTTIIYCLRMPYHSIIIAAGHFKKTQIAAYGEAILNIVLSLVLVRKYNLIGVTIATIIATLFRYGYYVLYLSKNILFRRKKYFLYRCIINTLVFVINVTVGNIFLGNFGAENYIEWAFIALHVFGAVFVITCIINYIGYPKIFLELIQKIIVNRKNRKVKIGQ